MLVWGCGVANVDNVVKPWLISQGSNMPFLLIFFGVKLEFLPNHPILGCILTVLWVVAVTNAVNLIDIMDGLAGGISVVACLFLILAGFPPVINLLQSLTNDWQWLVDVITSFSVITHFEGFQKGVLDSRDILFFLSVIGFSLFTTSVILRTHRTS